MIKLMIIAVLAFITAILAFFSGNLWFSQLSENLFSQATRQEATTTSTPPAQSSTPAPTFTPTSIITPTLDFSLTPTPTSVPTLVSTQPSLIINLLTGLPVEDPEILERRPIAIKVCNYPRMVRPQSGLSRADIVYEYYMERGISRFIAIFYGQDAEKVGPVRSGRFFDEHIFRMYEAIFVFGNADDRVIEYFLTLERSIVNRFILEHTEEKKIACQSGKFVRLCRDKKIASYNNLFANTAAITQDIRARGLDDTQPDLAGMRFDLLPPIGGESAFLIDINYSQFMYGRWVYDVTNGHYLRFQDTQDDLQGNGKAYAPMFDDLTDEPISAENVVVLLATHTYHTNTETTEIVQIDLTGQGPAYLFRDGKAYPANWKRPESGVLFLSSLDGKPLVFKPGVTFFQVIGQTSQLEQNANDWVFKFSIP